MRYFRESTIVGLLVGIVMVVMGLFKTIWSKHYHLIIAFILINWIRLLLLLLFSLLMTILISRLTLVLLLFSFRRWICLAHYGTMHQSWCDICWMSIIPTSWRTSINIMLACCSSVLIIKVLPCTLMIRIINILNTWWPLSLSIPQRKLISLYRIINLLIISSSMILIIIIVLLRNFFLRRITSSSKCSSTSSNIRWLLLSEFMLKSNIWIFLWYIYLWFFKFQLLHLLISLFWLIHFFMLINLMFNFRLNIIIFLWLLDSILMLYRCLSYWIILLSLGNIQSFLFSNITLVFSCLSSL